jgi:hypothetical protein
MHTTTILFSYIDPVSGMILLQLAIGGVIGCFASFRHKIWRFGAQFFSKQRIADESAESAQDRSMKTVEKAA